MKKIGKNMMQLMFGIFLKELKLQGVSRKIILI